MAQLMPLPLTVSCFSEIQIGFTFLVPAHLGSPGKRAVKRVYLSIYLSLVGLLFKFWGNHIFIMSDVRHFKFCQLIICGACWCIHNKLPSNCHVTSLILLEMVRD